MAHTKNMENTNNGNKRTAYGFIHVHSDMSTCDSPAKISDICRKAKEMGAVGLTLTDHGVCTGWFDFRNECMANGIKPVFGVEAYLKTDYAEHAHMLLLAVNYAGYQAISRAVTAAQANIDSRGGKTKRSIMTKEIVETYLSGGNVIATSACVGGVLACAYKANDASMESANKKAAYIKRYTNDPQYAEAVDAYGRKAEISEEISRLSQRKKDLSPIAKQSFRKRETGLSFITDEAEKAAALAAMERDMAERDRAKEEIDSIDNLVKELRKENALLRPLVEKYSTAIKNCEKKQQEIDEIYSALLTPEQINSAVDSEIEWLKSVFGCNFYIEMQYHGIPEEAEIMPYLAQAAERHNVPVVAANDSHMVTAEQRKARQILMSLRFEKWMPEHIGDSELYMKSDDELREWLLKILPPYTVEQAMSNVRKIIDMCNVVLPSEPHYPKYRDESGRQYSDAEAEQRLYALVNAGIEKKFTAIGRAFTDEYVERMKTELDVIVSMGFAHYFLIVEDIIRTAKSWSRYGVGPGRGSAAGSLVSYVLDITDADPIVYGLLFERFLNPERVSMPDIDIDFSDATRNPSIERLVSICGSSQIARIHTDTKIGAKEAIRSTARVIGYRMYPDDKDNRRARIRSIGDAITKAMPDTAKTIGSCAESIIEAIAKAPGATDEYTRTAKEIIEIAPLIEGCTKSFGTHAGGVVISDGRPITDYVPLMYTTDKGKDDMTIQQLAVQCDMNALEHDLRLLKMDFLGLNFLNCITECVERIKRNTSRDVNPYRLPFDDAVFREIFGKGNTAYVFQFESYGMRKMLRSFKPTCFEDVVLLVAAYRPGPMEFIPEIIKVKKGEKKPSYIIPQLEKILAPTYGYPIYQEQIMEIFRCAGFTRGEADVIRRLMSKKKKSEFLKHKGKFIEGMMALGAEETATSNYWDSLVSFSEYGFNKSHAVVYAIISYATAYFKYYYKREYMCGILNYPAKLENMPDMLMECRRMGIPLYPPDINESMYAYTEYKDGIRIGLKKYIKGVASDDITAILEERKNNGAFRGLTDFFRRCRCKQKTAELLTNAGAFDNLCSYERPTILRLCERYTDTMEKIRSKQARVVALSEPQEKQLTAKERASVMREIDRRNKEISALISEIRAIENTPSDRGDPSVDRTEILDKERQILGAFVSSHPLDEYAELYDKPNILKIGDGAEGIGTYIGMVMDVQIKQRKADGMNMAFFELEDKTGVISVACFAEPYKKYGQCIKNDAIVKIYGMVKMDNNGRRRNGDEQDDDDSDSRLLVVTTVDVCRKKKPIIVLDVPSEQFFFSNIAPYIRSDEDEDGFPVVLYSRQNGMMTSYDKKYGDNIFYRDIPGLSVKSTHGRSSSYSFNNAP